MCQSTSFMVIHFNISAGLPSLWLPWGFQSRIASLIVVWLFLSVQPMHFHFLIYISHSIGHYLVFFHTSALLVASGQYMHNILHTRQLMKIWILYTIAFDVFQVSQPYKHFLGQTFFIRSKAKLALLILLLHLHQPPQTWSTISLLA